MASILSDYQINQIVKDLLKMPTRMASAALDEMDLYTCDKDAVREALYIASARIASRKIAVSTFLIDLVFDCFLVLALDILGMIGWPVPLCITLFIVCIVFQSVRPLNTLVWFFGVIPIIAFIMQLVNIGFFYWFTPVFFVWAVFFFVISPRLQRRILNKIMSRVHNYE